jgi:uncharacterized membrane protein
MCSLTAVPVAIVVIGLALIGPSVANADQGSVGDDEIMRMVHKHCVMCHSETPSHNIFLGQTPPKGAVLETVDEVRQFAPRIEIQVVQKKLMPLGNETAMTDRERARFHDWIMTNTPPRHDGDTAEAQQP